MPTSRTCRRAMTMSPAPPQPPQIDNFCDDAQGTSDRGIRKTMTWTPGRAKTEGHRRRSDEWGERSKPEESRRRSDGWGEQSTTHRRSDAIYIKSNPYLLSDHVHLRRFFWKDLKSMTATKPDGGNSVACDRFRKFRQVAELVLKSVSRTMKAGKALEIMADLVAERKARETEHDDASLFGSESTPEVNPTMTSITWMGAEEPKEDAPGPEVFAEEVTHLAKNLEETMQGVTQLCSSDLSFLENLSTGEAAAALIKANRAAQDAISVLQDKLKKNSAQCREHDQMNRCLNDLAADLTAKMNRAFAVRMRGEKIDKDSFADMSFSTADVLKHLPTERREPVKPARRRTLRMAAECWNNVRDGEPDCKGSGTRWSSSPDRQDSGTVHWSSEGSGVRLLSAELAARAVKAVEPDRRGSTESAGMGLSPDRWGSETERWGSGNDRRGSGHDRHESGGSDRRGHDKRPRIIDITDHAALMLDIRNTLKKDAPEEVPPVLEEAVSPECKKTCRKVRRRRAFVPQMDFSDNWTPGPSEIVSSTKLPEQAEAAAFGKPQQADCEQAASDEIQRAFPRSGEAQHTDPLSDPVMTDTNVMDGLAASLHGVCSSPEAPQERRSAGPPCRLTTPDPRARKYRGSRPAGFRLTTLARSRPNTPWTREPLQSLTAPVDAGRFCIAPASKPLHKMSVRRAYLCQLSKHHATTPITPAQFVIEEIEQCRQTI